MERCTGLEPMLLIVCNQENSKARKKIKLISFCLCFSVYACMADSLCLFALVCLVMLSKQKRNQQAAPRRRADRPVSESVAVAARHAALRPSMWYREIEGGS